MENSNMKNMVVLKNLPSNMIEEAFVIIKPNLKIKQKREAKEGEKKNNKKEQTKDYIIKEAELLLQNYAIEMERKEEESRSFASLCKKYKKLQKMTAGITLLAMIGWLFTLL